MYIYFEKKIVFGSKARYYQPIWFSQTFTADRSKEIKMHKKTKLEYIDIL